MNVWRIHLKPRKAIKDPRTFCLSNNIVGVGWRIDDTTESCTWEQYKAIAKKKYKNKNNWKSTLNAFYHRIKINDLIWTKDSQNNYYLGRITSNWFYQGKQENLKADIVNIRGCKWYKVGTVKSIPPKLINYFTPPTLQRVKNQSLRTDSKDIYNQLSGNTIY